MTLELRIEQTLHAYNQNPIQGIRPKKILVGRQESEKLFEKAMIRTGTKFNRESAGGARLQYHNLSVYVVDEESYLWFAP